MAIECCVAPENVALHARRETFVFSNVQIVECWVISSSATLPVVSVIIAAFNARDCIGRAIDSICSDNGPPIEILVIDDCSTDDSCAMVEAKAKEEPRIRLIRSARNGGPSAARNRGLAEAKGQWVAVLDADDAWLPGRLSSLLASAQAGAADIIADNFAEIDLSRPDHILPALAVQPEQQWLDLPVFLQGARPGTGEADFGLLKPLFRLDFLNKHDLRYPTDTRHGEDFELVARALAAGARYRLDRASLFYLYTGRSSGLSQTRLDYSAQIRRARALAAEPAFSAQPVAARLLLERADALTRLELHRLSFASGRRPIAPRVLWRAAQSATGRQWLSEWVCHRVRKHFAS